MTLRVSEKELAMLSLSPAEVSALLEIPERRIRKEIEHGLLSSPPRLDFDAVVYLRAVGLLSDLEPSVEWRRRLLASIRNQLVHGRTSSVPRDLELVEGVLALHLRTLADEVRDRLVSFYRWRDARIDSDPSILGGDDVFRGTRLSVRRIGESVERGETASAILEDYPYLTPKDVEFAQRFARAYPRVGRPRESSKAAAR